MNWNAAILLSHRSAIDYCQPELNGIETRDVVEHIHENGIQVDIRKSDWRTLTDSLTEVLNIFTYLKNEATELLREYEEDQALEEFLETILSEDNIRENSKFTLNEEHTPNLENLQSAVEEMGIEKFRAYADDQIQCCIRGQERLDIVLDEKYERGGQSAGLFAATIKSEFEDKDAELLITTHIWSADVNGYLLTRHESPIYSNQNAIQDKMQGSRFQIISPQEVKPHMP